VPEYSGSRVCQTAAKGCGLLFHPADGDGKFLRNVVKLLPDLMASHPGRQAAQYDDIRHGRYDK
jgi:hypothetical protein